jgi:hypothetical protein
MRKELSSRSWQQRGRKEFFMTEQQDKNRTPRKPPLVTPMDALGFAALPLELLLHRLRSFGVRSVGPRASASVLIMILFVVFHSNDNCRPLTLFLVAVIPLSIVAQISATIRTRRGERLHSKYNGRPRIMVLVPRWNEITVKRLEPFVALLIGWAIHSVNHPLGAFVMTSAICLGLITAASYTADHTRALDLNDAIIEQETAAESLRRTTR